MQNAPHQIQLLSGANIEMSLALAALSVDVSERVFQRQLDFAKRALQFGSANMAKGLAMNRAPEPSEFAASCREHLQELLDLSKDCFEITLQTQTEATRAIKDNVEKFVQQVSQMPKQASESGIATAREVQDEDGEGAAQGKQRRKA